MKLRYLSLIALTSALTACATTVPPTAPLMVSTYANTDHAKRMHTYDWVAVQVTPQKSADEIAIKVYSHNDVKKRQTCSYEGHAIWNDQDKYITQEQIEFSFINDSLVISGSEMPLFYYCSSGASLAGTYEKI